MLSYLLPQFLCCLSKLFGYVFWILTAFFSVFFAIYDLNMEVLFRFYRGVFVGEIDICLAHHSIIFVLFVVAIIRCYSRFASASTSESFSLGWSSSLNFVLIHYAQFALFLGISKLD